jgi:hypothetical protein
MTALRPWSELTADTQARINSLISPSDVERFGLYHARQVARGRLDRELRSRWERTLRSAPSAA